MSLHVFSTQEKLSEVERIIGENRLAGYHNEILKAVAADLRGRLDGAPSVAMTQIERRLVATKRSILNGGGARPRIDALVGVGEETVARWPVIKQALERFGAEIEQGEKSGLDAYVRAVQGAAP